MNGGRLGYPKTPEHLDRNGYNKFTTVLIMLCQLNQEVICTFVTYSYVLILISVLFFKIISFDSVILKKS